jgi:hypothetical protein
MRLIRPARSADFSSYLLTERGGDQHTRSDIELLASPSRAGHSSHLRSYDIMPTTRKSPFATSFNSAIKRGVPCWQAVQQISKRTGKNTNVIFQSLYNAGCCFRQKVNGQWCYWPVNGKKCKSTFTKQCQFNTWQNFMDWCIASGFCTPRQFKSNSSSPTKFFNFLCNCWAKSFNKMSSASFSTSKSKSKKHTTTKAKSKSRKTSRRTKTTKAYRFPTMRKHSTSRRYRQAA